ncbi:hypothetical protein BCR44DRAFT_1463517 [Catenaria anguillulae PL171]|uniref:Ankyrin repeat-containing domain protein n=1 Tax=Catenaria anguillulae PL171 TaxID=765915 RepID=A0A1Y2HBD6_9FUNG|nr:hypothetical protein BCR44DRAFT_1463517 [Catenaria anguillulae PL171]
METNSERQLLELALTLLGYNLTPASTTSPSPPTSAAHSTVNPSSLFSLLGNGNGSYGHQHQHVESTTDALLHMLTDATSATSPLELAALRAVQRMVATHPPASEASAATVLDARRSATGAALVHLAAANKFGRLLRWLVREAKVDAGVRDGLGRTPVEIAEAQGWQEGVEVLSGVFETPAGDVTTSKSTRPASPVKSQEAKVVVLDKLEDAVLSAASEKEKALLLTDTTTSTAPPSLVSEPAASSSTSAVTRTTASNNNTLTGWHIHTRIAATFRDPATRWIIQLVLITMLVAAAAHQVQQAIVYQGDVWLAKAAKSTIVGVSDALSWLDFPEEPAYAPAPVEEDDGAIVGGVKWQRAVDKLWGAPQEHQGRACKVVDQESGRCVEEGGAEAEDLWELGRSWRMAVS